MFRGDVTERLAWLYRGNPHGRAVTWLAFDQVGAPVGVTSVFPRKVQVGGRACLGSIGGDCYIVPKARRKGLATQLHRATRDGMQAAGIDFMYGPPLPRNLGALLKAGSRAVGALRRYTRPLTGEAFFHAVARRKHPLLAKAVRLLDPPIRLFDAVIATTGRDLSLTAVSRFDERFDLLARDVRAEMIVPVRDRSFLEWRYIQPGVSGLTALAIEAKGELVGFAALEIRDDTAVIVDLYTLTKRVETGALARIVNLARERGCTHLDYYSTAAGVNRRTLKMLGFVGREERVFQVLTATDGFERPLLFNADAWLFTEGDKDAPSAFSGEPE
jgi:hypothetical protein